MVYSPNVPRLVGEGVSVDDIRGDGVECKVDDGHISARLVNVACNDDGGRVRGDVTELLDSVEWESTTPARRIADRDRVLRSGITNALGGAEEHLSLRDGDILGCEVLAEGITVSSVVFVNPAEEFRRVRVSRNGRFFHCIDEGSECSPIDLENISGEIVVIVETICEIVNEVKIVVVVPTKSCDGEIEPVREDVVCTKVRFLVDFIEILSDWFVCTRVGDGSHRQIASVQRGEKNPERGHPTSSVVRRGEKHPTGSGVMAIGTPLDFRRKRGSNRMKSPDLGRGHPTSSDVSVRIYSL
jgi:hypothetical protein